MSDSALTTAVKRLLAFADERGIDLGSAGARVRNALDGAEALEVAVNNNVDRIAQIRASRR